ncbi:MAG: lipid-A-disaccharide synthase, partial [Planctomycetota bacterium]
MRIFFSVGEPSGDLHASNLIKALRKYRTDVTAVGYGGPMMKDAGCEILFDLTQLAVMFLSGVFQNFRTFLGLIGRADRYF